MEKIYQDYTNHQLVGLMIYEELSNCMDFLNLEGYKRQYEYYFVEEMIERKHFIRYYINHYSKLLKEQEVKKIDIIPSQYYNYEREDISREYKCKYIKDSLLIIRDYYLDSIEFLNKAIKEIVEKGKIQDMCLFKDRLECYSQRLKCLDRHLIYLDDIGYNLDTIETFIQPDLHEKYKEKMDEKYNINYC